MEEHAEMNQLQTPWAQLSCCQLNREGKRNQIPLACVHQCLETNKQNFQNLSSLPFVSFPWVVAFCDHLSRGTGCRVSGGRWVAGGVDSLTHLSCVSCCSLTAEPH